MLGYYTRSGAEFVPKLIYTCLGYSSHLLCKGDTTDFLWFHAMAATIESRLFKREHDRIWISR